MILILVSPSTKHEKHEEEINNFSAYGWEDPPAGRDGGALLSRWRVVVAFELAVLACVGFLVWGYFLVFAFLRVSVSCVIWCLRVVLLFLMHVRCIL